MQLSNKLFIFITISVLNFCFNVLRLLQFWKAELICVTKLVSKFSKFILVKEEQFKKAFFILFKLGELPGLILKLRFTNFSQFWKIPSIPRI